MISTFTDGGRDGEPRGSDQTDGRETQESGLWNK